MRAASVLPGPLGEGEVLVEHGLVGGRVVVGLVHPGRVEALQENRRFSFTRKYVMVAFFQLMSRASNIYCFFFTILKSKVHFCFASLRTFYVYRNDVQSAVILLIVVTLAVGIFNDTRDIFTSCHPSEIMKI